MEIESTNNRLAFTLLDGSGGFDEYEPGGGGANQIPTGQWTHVAATYDGSHTSIYINGVHIGTNAAKVTPLFNAAHPYYMGWTTFQDLGHQRYFDGRLDEVAVLNQALNAGDILQYYNSSLGGQNYCN
ncbi:LamG domain-containing protein [Chloroflexi bacterium TSY]|nr:LamG domain-containing protein [Chloroflexi bacterium TSY]